MEMGEDCARYLEVIDDQHEEVVASRQLASCQTPARNTGKRINEFHPLKESKLVTFRNLSIQALWFGELFGLVPESLQVHKEICEGIMQRNADTTTVSVVVASDKQNMLQTVFTPPIWSKQPLLS